MFILLSILMCLPAFLFFITISRNIFGKIYIISIEANIGSGKSTFLTKLQKLHPEWFFLLEPVDIWKSITDTSGNSILSEFYKNQKRFAYTFQNFAFITRVSTLNAMIQKIKQSTSIFQNKYLIVERSIYSDKNVFAKMLYDNQNISNLEYELYLYWFHKLHSNMLVSGHIYLQVDPTISFNRVKKRARKEEVDCVPLEYLKSVHLYHDTWLNNTPVPTLVINADLEFENDEVQLKNMDNSIKPFIERL
jgi:deoxyadenosine/deoxycytidine kinase